MAIIDKKDVRKLAELSRIKLGKGEEESLVGDLEGILGHFGDLEKVDVEGVEPVAGDSVEENVTRSDEDEVSLDGSGERTVGAFPERDGDHLRVPPVFENDK